MIEIFHPSLPIAQCRPRVQSFRGIVSLYDPHAGLKKAFRKAISSQLKPYAKQLPHKLAVTIDAEYCFLPADTASKKERHIRMWGCSNHFNAKDVDNLLKFTFDALNGIIWEDDRQIISVTAKKIWSDHNSTRLKINLLDNQILNLNTEAFMKHFTPELYHQFVADCAKLIATPVNPGDPPALDALAFNVRTFALTWAEPLGKLKRERVSVKGEAL